MSLTEAQTRKLKIDQALLQAGWNVSDVGQVGLEIPVDGSDPALWAQLTQQLRQGQVQASDLDLPSGIADYVLYRENGEVLAVVEAKKTSVNPLIADAQGRYYARKFAEHQSFHPFVFLTNGNDIYFIEDDLAPKRLVYGFFTRGDLENLLFVRQQGRPLSETSINGQIAGRDYQQEAIRRVGEAFEQGRRQALVVMATGTGKTRTAMGLVDQFLRADQARRVLFVADRDALVDQALEEGFQEHLPTEPAARIHGYDLQASQGSRLFVCTLQTMNNLIENAYSPAFFDLIIFDEVHRSIFNKYKAVLDYFDGRMVGLTATPAHFVDRNTLLAFGCDEAPTFLYSYQDAIDDGHLVDYTLNAAKTKFQRDGIKGADLSEEEVDALIEAGIDPDEIDFEGSDLEKKVSNRDTIRRQWEEIMDTALTDRGGLIGKTIVFALTQEHALRLKAVFDEMYPHMAHMAEVITYKTNYKGGPLEAFKKKSQPRIAISVDMLDTGVNVPEVLNLVIMKPVQSRIKLEQMIGRGTRNNAACKHQDWLPEEGKTGFQILDFWENKFDREGDKAPPQTLAVNIRIFNTRLSQLELLLGRQEGQPFKEIVAKVRTQIGTLPLSSFTVKRHLPEFEQALQDDFWSYLTSDKLKFLKAKVGPLLRYAVVEDVDAQTFTSKVEGLKLEKLGGKASRQRESIQEDVGRVPESILETEEDRQLRTVVLQPSFASAPVEVLEQVMNRLAKYMNRKTDRLSTFIELDLADVIAERSHIVLDEQQQPVYAEEYRKQVNGRIHDLVMNHPAVQTLLSGGEVDSAAFDLQLLDLERLMRKELGRSYLSVNERNIHRAYQWRVGSLLEFVSKVLELPSLPDYRQIVERQFDGYISSHTLSGDQLRFVKTLKGVVMDRKRLEEADLYDAPQLQRLGADAASRLFTEEQKQDLLTFGENLTVLPTHPTPNAPEA
ncbi:hypothetical protein Dxin01_04077 [Deinococcus xinjiangensis]|uniref:Uncharacterized protein n=1 Tax=Deinococcus xinjiangensis TaxID=457454 RepID=A0ABP9VKW4_9DEIO